MIDAGILQARIEFYQGQQKTASERLAEIDKEREQLIAQGYAFEGAIQNCKWLLEHMEPEQVKEQVNDDPGESET